MRWSRSASAERSENGIGEVITRVRRLSAEQGSRIAPLGLALLFSLVMIPGWTDALSHVATERRSSALLVSIVYGLACVLAAPLANSATSSKKAVCVVLLVLGGVLVGLTGLSNSWVLLCGLCVTAALLPTAMLAVVTALVAGGLSLAAVLAGAFAEQFSNLVMLLSSTAAVALMVNLMDANAELKRARDQIALFAVAKERERFARDLHDILGHSLTSITVKAALARRVLETGDVDHSMTEIRDVERLSRQALNDIRGTVSEYREVTLAGELAGASEILSAAGIEADLPHAVDDVEPEWQQMFGYVLREAITNVVRHSGAHRVTVGLGGRWISVFDDGLGAQPEFEGNGLAGLAERLHAVNGTLEAGPGPGPGGFVVRASVPAESPAAVLEAHTATTRRGAGPR